MKRNVLYAIGAVVLGCALWLYAAEKYQQYRRPVCEWCGRPGTWKNKLNVHHNLPQHVRPDLANTETNCVTLCRECHWVLGHQRQWTNVCPFTLTVVQQYGRAPWKGAK